MKNKTKGAIAAVAGVALLAGGSTFALWSASDSASGGTITNGNLAVKASSTMAWTDVSADRTDSPHAIDLATWQMVPGDEVEGSQGIDVALQGDNLAATLTLSAKAGTVLPTGVTVTYDVVQGDDVLAQDVVVGTPVVLQLQSAENPADVGRTVVGGTLDGTADLTVVTHVSFDKSTADQTSVLAPSTLAGLSVSLEQVRTGSGADFQ